MTATTTNTTTVTTADPLITAMVSKQDLDGAPTERPCCLDAERDEYASGREGQRVRVTSIDDEQESGRQAQPDDAV